MAKEYIPIFLNWLDDTQDLTPEEKGNLVDAMVCYASGKDFEQYLQGGTKIAFRFMKGMIDRSNAISGIRSKARTGKEETESNDNKPNQTATNDNKTEQTESNASKSNQTESNSNKSNQTESNLTEEEKEKEEENEKEKEKRVSASRFTPPTVEDVTAYCRERNNDVNPQRWFDFYSAKGWKIGANPMKDWKAAVRTWEQRDDNRKPVKQVQAARYTQRQYTEEELEQLADDPVISILEGTA